LHGEYSGKRHSAGRSNVSSILSNDPNYVEKIKPSTKLHAPPGGKSSNIFSDEPVPLKTTVPIDPRRFKTQINIYDNTPPTPRHINRKDPNRSSMVDFDENAPITTGRRIIKDTNESHFNLAPTESDYEKDAPPLSKVVAAQKTLGSHFSLAPSDSPIPVEKTAKRLLQNTNESHFSISEDSNAPLPPHHFGKRMSQPNLSTSFWGSENEKSPTSLSEHRRGSIRDPNATSASPLNGIRPSSRLALFFFSFFILILFLLCFILILIMFS